MKLKFLAFLLTASTALAVEKPNIVYIMLDDIGYYELSHMGHPEMKTPNIDLLAKEGTRFTQMLAGGPLCAPTRCSLLTGKHGGRMTVRANSGADALRADEATIASMLKKSGYATGGFGKWGCGARGTSGIPETHGFDEFFGYYDQVHAHTHYPRYLIHNSKEVPLAGNTGDPTKGETFSQNVIFAETKKFIRANKDQPFLAYCAWTPPHGLWGIPRDDPSWKLYKDKPWTLGQRTKDDAKIYAAMVNMIDRQLGEIRDLLGELKIADRTIIIFSGDNGAQNYFPDKENPAGIFSPNVNPQTEVAFRGYKGTLYEGGLRVPYIAHWPGKIPAGKVSDQLGYFPDVMPTLAELCHAECPEGTDGISIAPTLLGKGEQKQHEYLYWEFRNSTAVRMANWKAIRTGGEKSLWQLYDLKTDISEKHDLAEKHPDIVKKMAAFAKEAHEPRRPGKVLDPKLANKDRFYMKKP